MRAGNTVVWNSSKSTFSKVNMAVRTSASRSPLEGSRESVLRPRGRGFELAREPEQGGFVAELPEDLHAHRESAGRTVQRHRHRGLAGQVGDRGEAAHRGQRVQ